MRGLLHDARTVAGCGALLLGVSPSQDAVAAAERRIRAVGGQPEDDYPEPSGAFGKLRWGDIDPLGSLPGAADVALLAVELRVQSLLLLLREAGEAQRRKRFSVVQQ